MSKEQFVILCRWVRREKALIKEIANIWTDLTLDELRKLLRYHKIDRLPYRA